MPTINPTTSCLGSSQVVCDERPETNRHLILKSILLVLGNITFSCLKKSACVVYVTARHVGSDSGWISVDLTEFTSSLGKLAEMRSHRERFAYRTTRPPSGCNSNGVCHSLADGVASMWLCTACNDVGRARSVDLQHKDKTQVKKYTT